jgi:hypothetical protein
MDTELKDNRGCLAILKRIAGIWLEDFTYENQPGNTLRPFFRTLLVTCLTHCVSFWLFWTGLDFCPMGRNYICVVHRLDLLVQAIIKLIIFYNIIALYYTVVTTVLWKRYCCICNKKRSKSVSYKAVQEESKDMIELSMKTKDEEMESEEKSQEQTEGSEDTEDMEIETQESIRLRKESIESQPPVEPWGLNKCRKLINSNRFHMYWILPLIILYEFSFIVPTDSRWDVPVWEATKYFPIFMILIQFCIYLNTVVLYKKIGKIAYTIYTSLGFAFWIFIYFWRIHGSCRGYGWTLDNIYSKETPYYTNGKYPLINTTNTTQYDFNSYLTGCQYSKPYVCWHFVVDGIFEPLYWSGQECDSKKNMDRLINKQYTDLITDADAQVVAMPLVDTSPENKRYAMAMRTLSKQIQDGSHAIPRETIDSVEEEVFLDFSESKHGISKVVVKNMIDRDPKLKDRVKDLDLDNMRYNVLNIFIDTVSRLRFFRKYPKTANFLANIKNDPEFPSRVYEHKMFTSIQGYTIPNIAASVYGADYREMFDEVERKGVPHTVGNKYKDMVGFISTAKDNGYIVGRTTEFCPFSCWGRLDPAKTPSRDYEDVTMPDHNFYQMACDKNLFPDHNPYSPTYGPFGWDHRCFFQRDSAELQFDYTEQFWKLYPKKRKFMYMNILSDHNIAALSARYIDDALEKFLYKHYTDPNSDLYSNTLINIYSDHGDHMGMPIIFTYSGKQERHWPMFYQIMPKTYVDRNNKKIHNVLTQNQDRLMSHYDFFFTMTGIFDLEKKVKFAPYVKTERGGNMLETVFPKDRTPE